MLVCDDSRCIGCGQCARACYSGYLRFEEGRVILPEGSCLDCGHCLAVCPREALTLTGYAVGQVEAYDPARMSVETEKLLGAIRFKRSMRHFSKEAVTREQLEQILTAARYSPTVGNFQTMRFAVLQTQKMAVVRQAAKVLYEAKQKDHPETALFKMDTLRMIYEASLRDEDRLFHGAPAVIVVMDKPLSAEPGANAYIAASRMELVAQSMGLGSCYVGLFIRAGRIQPELFRPLGLTEDLEPCLALAVGHPALRYLRTVPRRPLSVQWL